MSILWVAGSKVIGTVSDRWGDFSTLSMLCGGGGLVDWVEGLVATAGHSRCCGLRLHLIEFCAECGGQIGKTGWWLPWSR